MPNHVSRTETGERPETQISGWRLAYLYPEVCRAHAEFGGDLEEMLREYHRQVIALPSSHRGAEDGK